MRQMDRVCRRKQSFNIELRTRSANYELLEFTPAEQVVLAQSLSPNEVARRYEKLAHPLKQD